MNGNAVMGYASLPPGCVIIWRIAMTEAMKLLIVWEWGSGDSGVAVQGNVDPGKDIDTEIKSISHQAKVVKEQYANRA